MCLDGNSAPASVRYLNAQLSASWKNAAECAAHYRDQTTVDLSSDSYKKSQYMRSLAEFHYGGAYHTRGQIRKDLLLFNGSFGEPRLQFICNHEAILHLRLTEGHLHKNFAKSSQPNSRINTHEHIYFKDLDIAVRMKFTRRALSSEDSIIGNGEQIIQLMVLDFASAKVLTRNHISQDILAFYVGKYLELLRHAGHHVLFDLPDFDNDQYSPLIDYSLAATIKEIEEYCTEVDLHGIHVSTINDHLRKSWLNAVALARGISGAIPADPLTTCLTEIQSIRLPDVQSHFHIRFSPPTVHALCRHEAVLVFNFDEIIFYNSPDFSLSPIGTYQDWKIAVIVDTVEVRNEHGVVIGFNFDFHTARWSRHLSTYFENDFTLTYFPLIVDFITTEYLQLLISYKFYEVFLPEATFDVTTTVTIRDGGSPVDVRVPQHWGDVVIRRPLFGFDQIISISEEAINSMFATLWRQARETKTVVDEVLVRWAWEGAFTGEFDAVKVQLLSHNQAIVRINVSQGRMALKGLTDSWVEFDTWTLAFLVDIKMVEVNQQEVASTWLDRVKDSVLGRRYTGQRVKHLILDFENTQFLMHLSSLNGIWDSGNLSAVSRLESVVHYTRKYLASLSQNCHNIIYSVPVVEGSLGAFSLTSVDFQIVSHTVRTITNAHLIKVSPVILVTGMIDHRPLPKVSLTWHDAWVAPKSYGTLVLSREIFLDSRLLPILANINAKTTVLPRFPNPDEDEFSVHLCTLEKHPYRRYKKIDWKLSHSPRPGFREYEYHHRDEWSYEHSGTFSEVGAYAVRCDTRNKLAIPVSYHPGLLEIVLHGETELTLKGTDQHKDWSQTSKAKWSSVIRIVSEWNGLHIDVASSASPTIDVVNVSGNWSVSARDLLAQHLPQIVDIGEVIGELRHTLEGAWEYAFPGLLTYNFQNPSFTVDGDLIVQLRIHDPHYKPSAPGPLQIARTASKGLSGLFSPSTPLAKARTFSPSSPGSRKSELLGHNLSPSYGSGNGSGRNSPGFERILKSPLPGDHSRHSSFPLPGSASSSDSEE